MKFNKQYIPAILFPSIFIIIYVLLWVFTYFKGDTDSYEGFGLWTALITMPTSLMFNFLVVKLFGFSFASSIQDVIVITSGIFQYGFVGLLFKLWFQIIEQRNSN